MQNNIEKFIDLIYLKSLSCLYIMCIWKDYKILRSLDIFILIIFIIFVMLADVYKSFVYSALIMSMLLVILQCYQSEIWWDQLMIILYISNNNEFPFGWGSNKFDFIERGHNKFSNRSRFLKVIRLGSKVTMLSSSNP